jgi:valyl-tRNA synthetase
VDVLDTWFSSALWLLHHGLARQDPRIARNTDLRLVTAFDILFFGSRV